MGVTQLLRLRSSATAISGRGFNPFNRLRRHFRPNSRPACPPAIEDGRACGRRAWRGAVSGRGFNLFNRLRRHFRPSCAGRRNREGRGRPPSLPQRRAAHSRARRESARAALRSAARPGIRFNPVMNRTLAQFWVFVHCLFSRFDPGERGVTSGGRRRRASETGKYACVTVMRAYGSGCGSPGRNDAGHASHRGNIAWRNTKGKGGRVTVICDPDLGSRLFRLDSGARRGNRSSLTSRTKSYRIAKWISLP